MANSQSGVIKLYQSVIEDVISGVRDSFLDEGVDEQILQELKQLWETKIISSKAVEPNPEPTEPQPPAIGQKERNTNKSGGSNAKKAGATVATTAPDPVREYKEKTDVYESNLGILLTQTNSFQRQHQYQLPTANAQPLIDGNKQVPVQITLPIQAGSQETTARVLTIQVPASALQGNALHTALTGPVIAATMALPTQLASTLLQQHVNASLQAQAASSITAQPTTTVATTSDNKQNSTNNVPLWQVDGPNDTSDEDEEEEDEDDLDDDDEDDKDEEENEDENDGGPEEEPLNSGDDVSDEDLSELFETENVVVCQYDKITRSRNKWKFYLKDGIMNLSGKDFVFQKANGDAEW